MKLNIKRWLEMVLNPSLARENQLRVEHCDESLFQLALVFGARDALLLFLQQLLGEICYLLKSVGYDLGNFLVVLKRIDLFNV